MYKIFENNVHLANLHSYSILFKKKTTKVLNHLELNGHVDVTKDS